MFVSCFSASFISDVNDHQLSRWKHINNANWLTLWIFTCCSSNVSPGSNLLTVSSLLVQDDADVEWKFARAKLWFSYFEHGGTLPVPFNLVPSPMSVVSLLLGIRGYLWDVPQGTSKEKPNDEMELNKVKHQLLTQWCFKQLNYQIHFAECKLMARNIYNTSSEVDLYSLIQIYRALWCHIYKLHV